jgi:predicted nucleic acid-binding protein
LGRPNFLAETREFWSQAALRSGIAVYDTLFVELAERERIPLATFDEKVLKAYPEIAKRPRDLH